MVWVSSGSSGSRSTVSLCCRSSADTMTRTHMIITICVASLAFVAASGNHQFDNYQYPGVGGAGGSPYDFHARPPFSPPSYLLEDTERDDDDLSFLQRLVRPWTWFSWLTERSDSTGGDDNPFDHYQEVGTIGVPYDRYGLSAGAAAGSPYDTRYLHAGESSGHFRSQQQQQQLARLDQRHAQPSRATAGASSAGWHSQAAPAFKTARSDANHQLQVQQQSVRTSVETQQGEASVSNSEQIER